MPHRVAGQASPRLSRLLAVVLLAVLSGCGGSVEIDTAPLPPAQAAACAAFAADLPRVLDGLARQETSPADAPGAAWGDPAVVVTCGVQRPEDLDRFASCEEVEGVGWFLSPQTAYDDQAVDVRLTTIGVQPRVRLDVPGSQRPPADYLAVLSRLVREHLRVARSCV